MTAKTRMEIFISGSQPVAPLEIVSGLKNWALLAELLEIKINPSSDELLFWKIHFIPSVWNERKCADVWAEIQLHKSGQESVVLAHITISDHQVDPVNISHYVDFLALSLRRRQAVVLEAISA